MKVYAENSKLMFSCECGETLRVPNSKTLRPFIQRLHSFENQHKHCKHNNTVELSKKITFEILNKLQAKM